MIPPLIVTPIPAEHEESTASVSAAAGCTAFATLSPGTSAKGMYEEWPSMHARTRGHLNSECAEL
eukprot:14085505-Alexandrium_andersonii.AAC.1